MAEICKIQSPKRHIFIFFAEFEHFPIVFVFGWANSDSTLKLDDAPFSFLFADVIYVHAQPHWKELWSTCDPNRKLAASS